MGRRSREIPVPSPMNCTFKSNDGSLPRCTARVVMIATVEFVNRANRVTTSRCGTL